MELQRQIPFRNRAWNLLLLLGSGVIDSSDQVRNWFLKHTMKFHLFRTIYKTSSLRLGGVFFLCTLINLPLALTRPDLLLVFGPLIYGYFHVVASYYYVQPANEFIENNPASKSKFKFLVSASLIAIVFNLFIASFGTKTEIPHGGWEMITALIMFGVYAFKTSLMSKKMVFAVLALNIIIFRLAWDQPLNFVSATLFLHNWIAFIYWIIVAKDKANRMTAVISTLVFGIIHYLVAMGFLDHLLVMHNSDSIVAANSHGTAWILSPWSFDPLVGRRALVLYTYGLSTHYFVWLKAIPENRQKKEAPNNFKTSFEVIKKGIGNRMMIILTAVAISGSIVWVYSFSIGAAIYFTIASIHIWLELNFLVPRFVNYLSEAKA
jgi:hypothetical protein